jgi:hypothetical protein
MYMTTEEAPILCMSRSIGSWMVRLHAVSVGQFVEDCGWPTGFADSAIERLMNGVAVHDTDAETCYSWVTYRPSAVLRQWLELRDSGLS